MRAGRRPAFTLIELLVVIGIIVALVGAIFGISSAVFSGAKEKETKAMMLVVQEAIDEFQRNAPLGKVNNPGNVVPAYSYAGRYNNYPPDELELFTTKAVDCKGDGANTNDLPGVGTSIGPGGAIILGDDANLVPSNRSLKAMVLAIRSFSPSGSAILDRLDSRYFQDDKLADSLTRLKNNPNFTPAGTPEFLDRNGSGGFELGDRPLEVIIDAWGQPLEYFCALVPPPDRKPPAVVPQSVIFSSLVREANNNQPVLMSYGPDGPDQLSMAVINSEFGGVADQVTVWYDYMSDATPNVMDNKYNLDNIFSNDAVKTRLMEPKP